eukprot:scaffold1638_cov258-Pinguiococcus_pyrenoidosus.AAC.39
MSVQHNQQTELTGPLLLFSAQLDGHLQLCVLVSPRAAILVPAVAPGKRRGIGQKRRLGTPIEAAPLKRVLDLLQREALGLRNVFMHKVETVEEDPGKDGEGDGVAHGSDLQEEQERNDEVQEKVCLRRDRNRLASHLQREHLAHERPHHRAETDLVAADVHEKEHQDDGLVRVKASPALVGVEGDGNQDGSQRHEQLERPDQDVCPRVDARVPEYGVSVVHHRGLPRDLLKRHDAQATDELRSKPWMLDKADDLVNDALIDPLHFLGLSSLLHDIKRDTLCEVLREHQLERLHHAVLVAPEGEPPRGGRQGQGAREDNDRNQQLHKIHPAPAADHVDEPDPHCVSQQNPQHNCRLLPSHQPGRPVHREANTHAVHKATQEKEEESPGGAPLDQESHEGEDAAQHVEHRADRQLSPSPKHIREGKHDHCPHEGSRNRRRGYGALDHNFGRKSKQEAEQH